MKASGKNKIRRVLIIAEQYYPLMVPGAFRVASFARYLPEFGFAPLVIAPKWNKENVVYSRHGGLTAYVEGSESCSPCTIHNYPTLERRETPLIRYWNMLARKRLGCVFDADSAQKVGVGLYREKPYCAIIASGYPEFVWHAADNLSKALKIPWIADVRDVSGQITGHRQGSFVFRTLKKLLNVSGYRIQLERELLNSASLTTTVSEPLRDTLLSRGVSNPHVVLNGFDEEDYRREPVAPGKFRILYAGWLHQFRDPTILLDAIDEIIIEKPHLAEDFELCFYSNVESCKPYFDGRPCSDLAVLHPFIAKQELIPIMMGASILLHVSTPGSKGILTSKLTEYLGAGRPILTVPGDGDVVDNFLKETQSGISCATVQCAKAFLLEQWQRWKQGIPSQYISGPEGKYPYTRRAQCSEMARLLASVV